MQNKTTSLQNKKNLSTLSKQKAPFVTTNSKTKQNKEKQNKENLPMNSKKERVITIFLEDSKSELVLSPISSLLMPPPSLPSFLVSQSLADMDNVEESSQEDSQSPMTSRKRYHKIAELLGSIGEKNLLINTCTENIAQHNNELIDGLHNCLIQRRDYWIQRQKQTVPVVKIDLPRADIEQMKQSHITLNSALHKLSEQVSDIISITNNDIALIEELAEQRLTFNNQRRQHLEKTRAARSLETSNQGSFFSDNGYQKNIHSAPTYSLKSSLLYVAAEGCDGADDFLSLVKKPSDSILQTSLLIPPPSSSLVVVNEDVNENLDELFDEDDKDSMLNKPHALLQNAMFVSENIEDDKDSMLDKPHASLQNAMFVSENIEDDKGEGKGLRNTNLSLSLSMKKRSDKNGVDHPKTNAKDTSTTSFFTYFTSLTPSCSMFSSCTQQQALDQHEMILIDVKGGSPSR